MDISYTYLITNKNPTGTKRYYIGSRLSGTDDVTQDDYMGSSLDESFQVDLKAYPNSFEKIIIETFGDHKDAIKHEILLHEQYDVDKNPLFYNRAKQTSEKFVYRGGSSGRRSRTFKGFYVTPWGVFETAVRAAEMSPDPISVSTIQRMCKSDFRVNGMSVAKSTWFTSFMLGKTSSELGFRFIPVEKKRRCPIDKSVDYKGKNNPSWKRWYLTPWGRHQTPQEAVDSAPHPITKSTLYNWCMNSDNIVNERHTKTFEMGDVVGKTFKDVGFGVE